jgi:tRNA (guanine26-N2/guanine27-N2)-dimethyltransferase
MSSSAAVADASAAASAIIREGSATIDFGTANEVFYNKVQVLNRDLSIQMISAFAEVRKEEKMAQRKRNPAKYRREVHAKHGVAEDVVDLEKWSDRRDGIDVLEALSATGLRSVRYAKECVGIKRIVANDLDQKAADAIERNVLANGLEVSATAESAWPPVEVSCADASMLMYNHRKTEEQFDVIDLDPYGSAAPFLDSAVQAVADGGLLCITCTDSAVLCGNHSEVCFAKYGSVALRNKYCHEMGLRVLLASVEGHANRYGRHIVPVAALSIDFYVRVFLRVRESKLEVKQSAGKLAMVFQSAGTDSYYLQRLGRQIGHKHVPANFGHGAAPAPHGFKGVPLATPPSTDAADAGSADAVSAEGGSMWEVPGLRDPESGEPWHIGGPIWAAPMKDPSLLERAIRNVTRAPTGYSPATEGTATGIPTKKRLMGLLVAHSEELVDVPLYYDLAAISHTLHCSTPRQQQVRAALVNRGYRVSRSHCRASALKTDAPASVVWDVMRSWVAQGHPLSEKRRAVKSPGNVILSKPASFVADFTPSEELLQLEAQWSEFDVVRYPMNPEKHWGPKSRAGAKPRKKKVKKPRGGGGKMRGQKRPAGESTAQPKKTRVGVVEQAE